MDNVRALTQATLLRDGFLNTLGKKTLVCCVKGGPGAGRRTGEHGGGGPPAEGGRRGPTCWGGQDPIPCTRGPQGLEKELGPQRGLGLPASWAGKSQPGARIPPAGLRAAAA